MTYDDYSLAMRQAADRGDAEAISDLSLQALDDTGISPHEFGMLYEMHTQLMRLASQNQPRRAVGG